MAKRGKRKMLLGEALKDQPVLPVNLDLPAVVTPGTPVEAPAANTKEGGNGEDKDPPKEHVNDKYDAMPNEIEDPGAVFKLAFLDSERGRLQTQALLVKQEGDQNIKAMQIQYQTTLNELQRQIRVVEAKIKEHKDYIEKKHGVALRSYNYDDETGVLKKQVQTEQAGGKEEVIDGN